MESEAENKSICDLLKFTVIKFCQDNYVASGDLELDAIICLSPLGKQSQSVVKIHQILEQTDFNRHELIGEVDTIREEEVELRSQIERENGRNSNPDQQDSFTEKSYGASENSDDKWIRMNRLKVYKKKRKIVTQRRKPSVTCKLNGLDSPKNPPSSGYMLRVPSITNHITQYSSNDGKVSTSTASKGLDNENENHGKTEKFVKESKTIEMLIKAESTSPVLNESYDLNNIEGSLNDKSDTFQETKAEDFQPPSCQSVFPPRQSDSYLIQQNALNDSTDLDLSAVLNGTIDSALYENTNTTHDPQVIRKRKRKQSSQSILRISDAKSQKDGETEKKETTQHSHVERKSDLETDKQVGGGIPKIIIRRNKDTILAEKTIKQPRLVSLLTSGIPNVTKNAEVSKSMSKKNERTIDLSNDDTKNSKSENVLPDMADIVSMQKNVSSGRVMSLLKNKSSPSDSCIDRIYNCSKCGTGFKSKKSKMRHEKYTCGDLRSFECEVCGKFYSRADSKTRHMFRIHGIKPGFSGQSSLNDSNYSLDDSHFESLENEMHQNDSLEGFQNGVENDSE